MYEEAGGYDITLTVVDSLGATSTVTHTVEVVEEAFLARDSFARNVASGWGAADTGGTWTGTAGLSVTDGEGRISIGKSQTRTATLGSARAAEFDMSLVFSADKVADGGGIHFNAVGHKDSDGEYRAKLRISAAGAVNVGVATVIGTTETLIANKLLAGYTYTAGSKLNVRFAAAEATGDRTELKVKVWPVGAEEPQDWTISAMNAESRLQGTGQFGVTAYGTGSITNGPVIVSVDDLVVRGAGGDTPHAAPTARIASVENGLAVAFDGTGSTADGDADIAGYEWNFGDGATSTNAKPDHTYSANGSYTVTLTVTDSAGMRSVAATANITVAHIAPTARFDATATGLGVALNGSASTAASGASLAYQWTWGDDSAAGSGATATHTYGSEGSYDITLKVTDSKGATDSVTKTVQVSDGTFIARDDFGRDIAGGWGTADTGGAWTAGAGFSVSDGAGRILVGKSQTRIASLNAVSARDTDARLTFSTDKVADGGGLHLNFVAQRTSEGEYRAKLRISSAGVIAVGVAKVVGTTETLIANRNLSGYTHTAEAKVNVRFQTVAEGAGTTLRVKVWPEGTEKPTAWWVTTTDSESALQTAGQVQVRTYATGTVTNGPVTVSIDGLSIR